MSKKRYEEDIIDTDGGKLTVVFLGHGTLLFSFEGKTIHVDPIDRVADYAAMPGADIILLTHHHRDHLDPDSIRHILRERTDIILTEICAGELKGALEPELNRLSARLHVMKNGDSLRVRDLPIRAVPAYNIRHMRQGDTPFHVPGEGNGYLMQFAGRWIYIAGDTENIPEMKTLGDVHVAFLPMNLPYTMTPEMTAEAAAWIQPDILYPYHFGDTETDRLANLLKGTDIDLRIRSLA